MEGEKIIITIFVAIFVIAFLAPILTMVVPLIMSAAPGLMLPITIAVILAIIIGWLVGTYNKFVNLKQKVKQSRGGIDVYLKQRFDLIPNLVETVKGYANYEKEVLENITKLRQEFESSNKDDVKLSQDLNNRYTGLLAIVENYPELKASESFLNLQKNLSKIESQLQAARRIYNSDVTEYNIKRNKFPSNVIANMFGFEEEQLFEIADSERVNINIKI